MKCSDNKCTTVDNHCTVTHNDTRQYYDCREPTKIYLGESYLLESPQDWVNQWTSQDRAKEIKVTSDIGKKKGDLKHLKIWKNYNN